MKEKLIKKQKKFISEIRATCSENARENEIDKLNLMVDDLETNGIEISKENIHLYYESMSDREKIKYSHIELDQVFNERLTFICNSFGIDKTNLYDKFNAIDTKYYKTNGTENPDIFDDGKCLGNGTNFGTIEVSYFGVKDTLKPLNEYIAEIKQSPEYKAHLDTLQKAHEFDYMMLSRLQQDMSTYLNKECGHAYLLNKTLWAGNPADQIQEMKSRWEAVPVKPEWLSIEDINNFEKEIITARENQIKETLADATPWALMNIAKDAEIFGSTEQIKDQVAKMNMEHNKLNDKEFNESIKYFESMVRIHANSVKKTPEIEEKINSFNKATELIQALEDAKEHINYDQKESAQLALNDIENSIKEVKEEYKEEIKEHSLSPEPTDAELTASLQAYNQKEENSKKTTTTLSQR